MEIPLRALILRTPGKTGMRPSLALVLAAASAVLVTVGAAQAVRATRAAEPEQRLPARDLREGIEPQALVRHNLYFTRARYTANGRFPGFKDWRTDYPKADRQFLVVLKRLALLDVSQREHSIRLDDPELHRYPYLYAVEAGQMQLTDAEVAGLRRYLLAGGFLMVDDFWGSYEWRSFEAQMRRVFPEYRIVELPLDHPVFHTFYDIEEVVQVPNVAQGIVGGPTFEQDGYVPHVRGIFDEEGRLLVAINWNTDLGDAWEWAEQQEYPLKYSTYAYQIGVNLIVYAMSH